MPPAYPSNLLKPVVRVQPLHENSPRISKPFFLSALSRVKKVTNEDIANGVFDPNTMTFCEEIEAPDGTKVPIRERVYVPTELYLMFKMAGSEVKAIWGGTAGRWGKRKVDMDDIEIMIVAEKPLKDSP